MLVLKKFLGFIIESNYITKYLTFEAFLCKLVKMVNSILEYLYKLYILFLTKNEAFLQRLNKVTNLYF